MQVRSEANKKKWLSLGAIVLHVEAVFGLIQRHGQRLVPCGWTPKYTSLLDDEVDRLRKLAGDQLAARREAMRTTAALKVCLASALVLRRALYAALRHAASRWRVAVDLRDFTASAMGHKPQSVLMWMARVRTTVANLDRALQQGFMPDSPLARLDALQAELGMAVRNQAAMMQRAPAATAEVTEARARITNLIDDLVMAAETAFATEPSVLREFRKRVKAVRRNQPDVAQPMREAA